MKPVTSVKSVSKVLFAYYIYNCIPNLRLLQTYWKANFFVLEKAGSSF